MTPQETEWAQLTCAGPKWKKWPSLNPERRKSRVMGGKELSKAQIEKRVRYVNEHYAVIDWDLERGKAQVECKNQIQHTLDTGDGQCVIFIGSDDMGVASYHCSHAHCADFNRDETSELCAGFLSNEGFILPSSTEGLTSLLGSLFGRMEESRGWYRRSGDPPYSIGYWKPGMPHCLDATRGNLSNLMGEEKILFYKHNAKGKLLPVLPVKEFGSAILEAHQAECLPEIEQIVQTPILVRTQEGGCALVGETYCPELKTIVLGKKEMLPPLDFEGGVKLINSLLDYWVWKTRTDRSRALAELLTPALVQGGFIGQPIPAFLIMADQIAAGKTGWQQDVAQIYGHVVEEAVFTKLGIGGVEEKFQGALYQGDPFFFVDELDGLIKGPFLNAFITGGTERTARIAYRPETRVSTKMIIQMAGVKNFVVDYQLSSRALVLQIEKPVIGDANWFTPEDEFLKDSIREHHLEYLAAIYAIITEWSSRGSPRSRTVSWRFPEWERCINGILEMLKMPAATQGLAQLQEEISNPAQEWIPQFIKCLEANELLSDGSQEEGKICKLATYRQLCDNMGLEIPGVNPFLRDPVLSNIKTRKIGEIIASLPRAEQTNGREPIYRLGEFYLAQYQFRGSSHKSIKFYLFCSTTAIPKDVTQFGTLTDPN